MTGLYVSALIVGAVVLWAQLSARRERKDQRKQLELIAQHIQRQERPRLYLVKGGRR